MQDEVLGRPRLWNTQTKTHTNTHTRGQGKLYMPFRHFNAGAYFFLIWH